MFFISSRSPLQILKNDKNQLVNFKLTYLKGYFPKFVMLVTPKNIINYEIYTIPISSNFLYACFF